MSDTHSRQKMLDGWGEDWPEADIILHAGDVSMRGSTDELRSFLQWFGDLKGKHKIFIPGNHDLGIEDHPGLVEELINELKLDIIHLNNAAVTVEGIKIYGSPMTPSFGFGWAFNRSRGSDIAQEWTKIPEDTDILITHGPPSGYGDLTVRGHQHVGCYDLLERIEEINPKIHLSGHIHEGYGVREYKGDKACTTKFVNASLLNAYYQYMNQPVLIDYDSL